MRILAVASGGGHWLQLLRLHPAFSQFEVTYISTLAGSPESASVKSWEEIPDCNRNEKLRVLSCTLALARLIWKYKPSAVITTGALPGLIAITLAKAIGAKTIWVDSIANAEEVSDSGKMARYVADLYLTQWEHLARAEGPQFYGDVL